MDTFQTLGDNDDGESDGDSQSMSGDRRMLRVMFKERRSSKDVMVPTSSSATKYESLAPEQRLLELPVQGAGRRGVSLSVRAR
jgi:hypothetical protein